MNGMQLTPMRQELQEWESNPPQSAYETAPFNQNGILQ